MMTPTAGPDLQDENSGRSGQPPAPRGIAVLAPFNGQWWKKKLVSI
jgi:hypothetical protein